MEKISIVDYLTGEVLAVHHAITVYPASHFVTSTDKMERALDEIEIELEERVKWFQSQGLLLEAQRIEQRTRFDMEMMREVGYCNGMNYSRIIDGRPAAALRIRLLNTFPRTSCSSSTSLTRRSRS